MDKVIPCDSWKQCVWVFVTIMLFVGGAIITNDKMRASEDLRLETTWGQKLSEIQKDVIKIKIALAIKD